MIGNLIDTAECCIGTNGINGGSGFNKPLYPCLITMMMKNMPDRDFLRKELSFFWGNTYSDEDKIPMLDIGYETFLSEDYARTTSESIQTLKERNSNSFENLSKVFLFDVVVCDAIQTDKDFEKHCQALDQLSVPYTTVYKHLVLIHNNNNNKDIPGIFSNLRAIKEKIHGYDNVFLLSDYTYRGGVVRDVTERIRAFLPVIAFNTSATPNFLNTLEGMNGYSDALLTVSSARIEKNNREIAVASLLGIAESLNKSGNNTINDITPVKLREIFLVSDKRLKITNTIVSEVKYPSEQVFENMPYEDENLNTPHPFINDFIRLAVESNFYGTVDNWVKRNSIRIKKEFFSGIFNSFTFDDLAKDSNIYGVSNFLNDCKVDLGTVTVDNGNGHYHSAQKLANTYLQNKVLECWIAEVQRIPDRIRGIQSYISSLVQVLGDEFTELNADTTIKKYYGDLAKAYFQDRGGKIRQELCNASLEEGSLDNKIIQIIEKEAEAFFKENAVFSMGLIEEIQERTSVFQSIGGGVHRLDAIHHVANMITDKGNTNTYFPNMGVKNIEISQAALIFPENDRLYKQLKDTVSEGVGLLPISSSNVCVYAAVEKIIF